MDICCKKELEQPQAEKARKMYPTHPVRQFNLNVALSDRDLHVRQWRLQKANIWSRLRLDTRYAMWDLFTIGVDGNTHKLAEQYQRSVLILGW